MRKVLALFAILSIALTLGCDDFKKNTYATLKTAESLYVAVYDATLEAKRNHKISDADSNRIADALDIYEGSFNLATIAFQIWAQDPGEDEKKSLQDSLAHLYRSRTKLQKAFTDIMLGIEGVQSWDELLQK